MAQATLRVDLKDSSSGLLIPNYKGKQTFGLEMESNCAFTGRALDKHADYAAMAMVVYRKETVDGLSIPIGMMEVESHGNLEGMTFPARALDPADAKDVKCMIYFAYRLHRKTKLASMWKKAKETTTLEDLINSITKADALDDTVAKPEGCTFLEVVFGTFDPGTATQAELAEEADKDNHAVRSQSGKFMCVGYRGKLLRRDLKKTDAFCDFRSLKIKSRCRKNIFPQLNAHVNIRKFYGPEGASTRLLNRPTAGKKTDGPIVQSGEELDRSELLEKSEAIASKNLVARIELFYRKMKQFYKKVMTKDGEPAQAAVKQQHGDGDGNDDDDNDDDASDHETDE
eukprot:g6454.t1